MKREPHCLAPPNIDLPPLPYLPESRLLSKGSEAGLTLSDELSMMGSWCRDLRFEDCLPKLSADFVFTKLSSEKIFRLALKPRRTLIKNTETATRKGTHSLPSSGGGSS